jgi:hypothetical protein
MTSITTVTPVYNYSVEREGAYEKIVYKKTPVRYRLAKPLCFYTAVPALVAMGITMPAASVSPIATGLLLWVIWMVALAFGVVLLINYFRKPGEIKIGKTDLVAGNQTYDLSHVSSFLMKDPGGKYTSFTSVVTVTSNPHSLMGAMTGLTNGLQLVGGESRMAIKRYLREVDYKICIRYGSKDINIATGLGETDAEVLFDKILEISGYHRA